MRYIFMAETEELQYPFITNLLDKWAYDLYTYNPLFSLFLLRMKL